MRIVLQVYWRTIKKQIDYLPQGTRSSTCRYGSPSAITNDISWILIIFSEMRSDSTANVTVRVYSFHFIIGMKELPKELWS